MFTTGLIAEFVMREIIMTFSPEGRADVSSLYVSRADFPGGTSEGRDTVRAGVSESALKKCRGDFPLFSTVNSPVMVCPFLAVPKLDVLIVNIGRGEPAF